MAGESDTFDQLAAVAALGEPMRRRLYECVVARGAPVGRDEAAAALGIGRALAAFHLDRLVRAGLLRAEYRRLGGRTGPGAGRPAKLYARTPRTVEVSLPARRYELAAALLAGALEEADTSTLPARARAHGTAIGAAARSALARDASPADRSAAWIGVLREAGYEPQEDGRRILLRNCPFDALVAAHRDLTCSMNLAMLDGIRAGFGEEELAPRPVSIPGSCCVAFAPPDP